MKGWKKLNYLKARKKRWIKKKEKIKKNSIIFLPTTNKNKYKKIESKYKKENIISRNIKKINKKILGNKKDKKSSVDTKNTNKSGIKINLDEIKSKKENNPYESWTNHLLKLKKNKSCENSYKLNIRQSSAWNENDVNIIHNPENMPIYEIENVFGKYNTKELLLLWLKKVMAKGDNMKKGIHKEQKEVWWKCQTISTQGASSFL